MENGLQRIGRQDYLKKSTQVAIGGLSAAICLLLMFMTGLIPLSSYIFPSMAGIVLIAVAQENGNRSAVLVYVVTSLLALMIVPDREAVILFIMLLGYYPILKPKIECNPLLVRLFLKLLLLNISVISFYFVLKYLFAMPDMAEGLKYGAYTLLILANLTFFLYDHLVGQLMRIYTKWFRPKILRKIT